jgi:hypothetical protein
VRGAGWLVMSLQGPRLVRLRVGTSVKHDEPLVQRIPKVEFTRVVMKINDCPYTKNAVQVTIRFGTSNVLVTSDSADLAVQINFCIFLHVLRLTLKFKSLISSIEVASTSEPRIQKHNSVHTS